MYCIEIENEPTTKKIKNRSCVWVSYLKMKYIKESLEEIIFLKAEFEFMI